MGWWIAITVAVLVGAFAARRWWQAQWATSVTDEMIAWQFESLEWLLSSLGGYETLRSSKVHLPSDLAPAEELTGEARARWVFDYVQRSMGVAHWPCRLERLTPAPAEDGKTTMGTFQGDHNVGDGVIQYHPELEESVPKLVTVFAHEFGHYVLAAVSTENPGGPDHVEAVTDLCSVLLGFGVFATNVSLEPVVDDDASLTELLSKPGEIPWESFAYLGMHNFAYALAIVATLHDVRSEVAEALQLLGRVEFHLAVRDLDKRQSERLTKLRQTTGPDSRGEKHPFARYRELVDLRKGLERQMDELGRMAKPKKAPRRKRKKRRK